MKGKAATDETVEQTLEELRSFPLPLGWSPRTANLSNPRRIPTTFAQGIIKAVGLLLTTVALTLGAPFWFDFLKKFVGIRAAGFRPEK